MAHNETQRRLLEMLGLFDDLCTRENIRYMLSYGTLLGAVREKDFLAWDDDADLTMHREDFDTLARVRPQYLAEMGLKLTESGRGREKEWEFVAVIPNISREDDPDMMIEIMILDRIPRSKIKRRLQLLLLLLLQKMLRHDIDFSAYQSMPRKVIAAAVHFIGSFSSTETKLKAYRKISCWGNRDDSDWLFISTERPRFLNLALPGSIMASTIRMAFSGRELQVPDGWDTYLRLFYGDDYMVPKRENYYVDASAASKSLDRPLT